MKSKLLPNGLSRRTNRCLALAGIPINKRAIVRALKSGKLYPFGSPPNYGKYTHLEVCRWAGIDWQKLPTSSHQPSTPYPANGLSYRANRCLERSSIPAVKEVVLHALQSGALVPGKRPNNYGRQTHAELCRWAGVDPVALKTLTAKEKKPA